MIVCEWFIAYILPLFCDVSALSELYVGGVAMSEWALGGIRVLFVAVVAVCAVSFLIVLPYKWIMYLLRGGRKKKF